MRSCGVEEKFITGDASDKEKFFKWAECVGKAIGNPLFHWTHLELQRYFDYTGVLNKNTADEWSETLHPIEAKKSSLFSSAFFKSAKVLIETLDTFGATTLF